LQEVYTNKPGNKKLKPVVLIFRTDGESFAKLSAAILDKGPTVIIVWEENGNIFGGFASHSW
jgi:hypothetical protein